MDGTTSASLHFWTQQPWKTVQLDHPSFDGDPSISSHNQFRTYGTVRLPTAHLPSLPRQVHVE
eukprot:1938330-Amphidinium_carterae.1